MSPSPMLARVFAIATVCQCFWTYKFCFFFRHMRNPIKMSDIGFLKTEPNCPQNSKTENSSFRSSVFEKLTSAVWEQFFMLSHSHSSSNMIGSTVKVFFFMPCLCTSSSESLRLTISWTNSARKYVIHIKQHTVQKHNWKNETAVNFLKPKWKLQFFLQNWTKNRTKVIF